MIDPTQTETLDEIATWLLSAYRGRLVELRLTLLAHLDRRLLGVVPYAVRGLSGRREGPFNLPERETWQTLPSRDIRHAAEGAYRKMVPGSRFHPGQIDGAERLGVGRIVRAADLDPALAAALVERFGPLPRCPDAPAKPDAHFDEDEYSPVGDALREVAEWLIARYGTRVNWISLTIEGYYSSAAYWGIVPNIGRGTAPDGSLETGETLPTREIAAEAEALFARLVPGTIFGKISGYDVRDVASASVRSGAVSSHRRLTLIGRHGRTAHRE
jgi:hypothetical protein